MRDRDGLRTVIQPLGRMMASHSPDSSRALLARLWLRRDGAALVLVAAAMGCATIACLALLSPSVESFLIARQQGRVGFWGHAAMLPYASMYTLDHRACVGIPAHTMDEVAPEDVEMCERFAYELPSDRSVSCEVLPRRGPSNHFPTAGLFYFGELLETCGGDWLDVVVVSKGWRTETEQHARLFLRDGSPQWELLE